MNSAMNNLVSKLNATNSLTEAYALLEQAYADRTITVQQFRAIEASLDEFESRLDG